MGKGMDRKKEDKKKPTKTLEEKRAAKKEKNKREGRSPSDGVCGFRPRGRVGRP